MEEKDAKGENKPTDTKENLLGKQTEEKSIKAVIQVIESIVKDHTPYGAPIVAEYPIGEAIEIDERAEIVQGKKETVSDAIKGVLFTTSELIVRKYSREGKIEETPLGIYGDISPISIEVLKGSLIVEGEKLRCRKYEKSYKPGYVKYKSEFRLENKGKILVVEGEHLHLNLSNLYIEIDRKDGIPIVCNDVEIKIEARKSGDESLYQETQQGLSKRISRLIQKLYQFLFEY